MRKYPGQQAVNAKGWFASYKWFLLRRFSQLAFLALFLVGPFAGIWIVKGTLSSSMTLNMLPLTDPFIALQSLLAGHSLLQSGVIGTIIVILIYFFIGGRVYCSWVCPINIITDAAAWVHRRLELKRNISLPRATRYWLLAAIFFLSASMGMIVWEWVNPITMLHRGLLFGIGLGWLTTLSIFLFDLISLHGWCGHLCPVGAFYSLLNFFSIPRISAYRRQHCTDCLDCFSICPEPQVIRPALKGQAANSLIIQSNNCINCGRCIDICPENVFGFSTRFNQKTEETLWKR